MRWFLTTLLFVTILISHVAQAASSGPIVGVANGDVLRGTVRIRADISKGASKNTSVVFVMDGPIRLQVTERHWPFTFYGDRGFDTTSVPNGDYTLAVTITDPNNSTTTTVSFSINNPSAGVPLLGLQPQSTVSGVLMAQLNIDREAGYQTANYILSGPQEVVWQEYYWPFVFGGDDGFDTTSVPDGDYTLAVELTDANDYLRTVTVPFSIENEVSYEPTQSPYGTPQPTPIPTAARCPKNPPSLQSLIDKTAPGATLALPACVWREQVSVAKRIVIDGGYGATIKGSDIWKDWSKQGNTWISRNTVPDLPLSSRCDSKSDGRCAWPEQVFVNGQAYYQVSQDKTPTKGQFRIDGDRHVILADDPTGKEVEVTVREYWMTITSPNVTIQGMRMTHAGNRMQTGALKIAASNVTVLNSDFSYGHGANVSTGRGSNIRVEGNSMHHGGDLGLHGGTLGGNIVIRRNRFYDNNTEAFSCNFECGGFKFTRGGAHGKVLVEENVAYNNLGPGLWCDISCGPQIAITRNIVYNNTRSGIWFEISPAGGKIAYNVTWNNGFKDSGWGYGAGVFVSTSSNVEVYNNISVGDKVSFGLVEQHRYEPWSCPSSGCRSRSNVFHDNIAINPSSEFGLRLLDDAYGDAIDASNIGKNNQYCYTTKEGSDARFSWGDADFTTLKAFNKTPGEEGGLYLTSKACDLILAQLGLAKSGQRITAVTVLPNVPEAISVDSWVLPMTTDTGDAPAFSDNADATFPAGGSDSDEDRMVEEDQDYSWQSQGRGQP